MKMYYLAVMENIEGDRHHIMTCDKEKFFSEHKDLETLGYKVISCVGTTNRALYTKVRCKVLVSELKDLENKRMEHLASLYNEGMTMEVIRDTEKLYEELENTLINRVGMSYARFLRANENEEYEYTDELAIHCYNLREARMRLDNEIAKTTYTGWDC